MDQHFQHSGMARSSLFHRLRCFPFVPKMDAFLTSDGYFALLALLTVLCNAFGLEKWVYTVFILLGVYISFFGRDYLSIVPIVVCCYIAPYITNNPGAYETSVFYIGHGGLYFIILAVLFALSVLLRLALDPDIGRGAFFRAKRRLLPGILALGGAYLTAGAFSGHYFAHGTGNLVFALVQFAAIGVLYYILAGAVKWDRVPKDFFTMTGFTVGLILVVEIIVMYLTAKPFEGGELDRNVLYTGWGNYNCMGGLLTMMIPFAFHMATLRRPQWLYSFFGIVFLVGVLLTCSRTSILCAAVVYAASFVVFCLRSPKRRATVVMNVSLFGAMGAYMLLMHYDTLVEYLEIFTIYRSIQSRFDGFAAGIQQFLDYPLFGGSFYATDYVLEEWSTVENFTSFFPGLWHNTLIQIGASCGIVGLGAYAYHRLQTVLLVLRKPTTANLFIGLSVFGMLMMSLFDCHIFNIGPALFYSMALAFAEKQDNA